jgi:hypothetical protein
LAALLQRAALVAQLLVTVHGFSADTLLQALPCLLPSAPLAPPSTRSRWALVLRRLDAEYFLEPIEMGIGDRRSGRWRRQT